MQFAKRSSRASNTIALCLIPTADRDLSSPLESRRPRIESNPPPPRGARDPFFFHEYWISSRDGRCDPIYSYSSPPFPTAPHGYIYTLAGYVSSVNSICIVKIGNYTVTRVSWWHGSFVSLRFIRPRHRRESRSPPLLQEHSGLGPSFHRISIGFPGEPSFFFIGGGKRLDYN